MRRQRNKSDVPQDVMVGQIPEDPRWKFNPQFDVDPYPWRTLCLLYNSGTTQVRMNTSILFSGVTSISATFPEVHEEFTFENSPKGYKHYEWSARSFTFFNKSINDDVKEYNGALVLIKEAFHKGNVSEIGGKFLDRIWTLRVPETIRIPLNESIIVTVPIVVEAYSCEMERVKKENRGDFGLLLEQNTDAFLVTAGGLVANGWIAALVKGDDTSSYKLTPDYWTSFISVQSSLIPQVELVRAQTNVSCIQIHPMYTLLVFLYTVMTLIGCISWYVAQKDHFEVPSSSVEWADLAYEESITDNDKISEIVAKDAKLGIISDKIKILPKKETFPYYKIS